MTAPDLETARKLAKAVLDQRLAACANLIPQVESHYWWQQRQEASQEVMILFKTTNEKTGALEEKVMTLHPYETPAFVELEIKSGSIPFLQWIKDETSKS